MKKAFITGITGQDGSYLAEFLLEKGYEVHGTVRNAINNKNSRRNIEHLLQNLVLHQIKITDQDALGSLLQKIKPDEIYHLAGQKQSHDFEKDFTSIPLNIDVVHYILLNMKEFFPLSRFFFAGSSEMYGQPSNSFQNEDGLFRPLSPYGISKVSGYLVARMYREIFGLFACTGILFNHESPRRGIEFVTRKISKTVAEIACGEAKELVLGDLSAERDWGYAGDYVEAMWLMLQQEKAEDFVVGTGKLHSVGEFARKAFTVAGLDGEEYLKSEKTGIRSFDPRALRADMEKAKKILGWAPKTSFDELVSMMVKSDIQALEDEGKKSVAREVS